MADLDPSEHPLEVLSAMFNLAVSHPRSQNRHIEKLSYADTCVNSWYKQENSLETLPRMILKTWPSTVAPSAKRSSQLTRNFITL